MGKLNKNAPLENFEYFLSSVTLAIFFCLLPNFSWYFGSNSHFIINKIINGSPKSVLLDFLTYFPSFSWMILTLLFITNILTLFGATGIVIRVVKAISVYWLHQRLWVIGDGGMNLLVLSQLFLCLKDIPHIRKETREAVNDSLLFLLKGQFLLIYVTAFFSKMAGVEWVQGEALGIVVQIDKFQSPLLQYIFVQLPLLEKVLTIGVVLLQGLLPLGLVLGRGLLKISVIMLGVGMHLGIALHMGLVAFSIIMIIHYLLFLEADSIEMANWPKGTVKNLAQISLITVLILNFLSLSVSKSIDQRTEILNIGESSDSIQKVQETIPYASITKLFTLALIDRLQSKGLIDIDEISMTPAGKFNLRKLASFEAGILDSKIDSDKLSKFNWENWQHFFKVKKGYGGYSNFSYVMIQYILEKRLKKNIHQLFEENLNFFKLGIRLVQGGEIPFNSRVLAAFGLQGPLTALKSLSRNLDKEGFCFTKINFCVKGRFSDQVQFFLGDQGFNQLYVVIADDRIFAVNTWTQSYEVGL